MGDTLLTAKEFFEKRDNFHIICHVNPDGDTIGSAVGLALLTITLPAMGSLRDKQKLIVNCTQAIGGLTVNGNGATVNTGVPLLLAADDYFTLKYDATLNVWYRIG